jgi:hypothetical protein
MWERLSSRDQTITVLERRLFVAGKLLPREIYAKLTALYPNTEAIGFLAHYSSIPSFHGSGINQEL